MRAKHLVHNIYGAKILIFSWMFRIEDRRIREEGVGANSQGNQGMCV